MIRAGCVSGSYKLEEDQKQLEELQEDEKSNSFLPLGGSRDASWPCKPNKCQPTLVIREWH
jgi:hypothetical protein